MVIESYFDSLRYANRAIEKLNRDGLGNAFLDLKTDNLRQEVDVTGPSGTENGDSLAGLVRGSKGISADKAPLIDADPAVSGMGDFDEITNLNYKVLVKIDDEKKDEAMKTLKDMGGMFV